MHMLLDPIPIIYSNSTQKIVITQSVWSCPDEQKKSKLMGEKKKEFTLYNSDPESTGPVFLCTTWGKNTKVCSLPLLIPSLIHLHLLFIISWSFFLSGASIPNFSISLI